MEFQSGNGAQACLLCTNAFDRKPLIEEKAELVEEWNKLLTLFVKLLGGESWRNDLELFRNGEPWCTSCNNALCDLQRLQELIDESQKRLREVVDTIKLMISSSSDVHQGGSHPSQHWLSMRGKLLGQCLKVSQSQKSDPVGDDIPYMVDPLSSQSTEEGFGALHVLPDFPSSTPASPASGSEYLPSPQPEQEPRLKRTGRHRKIPDSSSSTLSTQIKTESFPDIKPCFVSLSRIEIERECQSDSSEEYEPERKKRKSSPRPGTGRTNKRECKVYSTKFKRMFYIIKDDLLVFLCTPVKFTYKGFNCLESGCRHFVEGTDLFSFEKIKDHILECHEEHYKDKIKQNCLLCPKTLPSAAHLRSHLIADHTSTGTESNRRIVICEVCQKPVIYCNYERHAWSHKSEEEQQAAFASGEKLHQKIEALRKSLPRNIKTGKKTRRKPALRLQGGKISRVFYKITDEILLLIFSPIKVTLEGFTCMENGCGYISRGNDFAAFQDIKDHVVAYHEQADYKSKTIQRQCPLCPLTFPLSCYLRSHLLNEHTELGRSRNLNLRTVICETCWKPVLYPNYPLHDWSHKSPEEQQQTVETTGRLHSKIRAKLAYRDNPNILPTKRRNRALVPKAKLDLDLTNPSQMLRKTCATDELFYLLRDDLLFYKTVFIQFSPQEFICLTATCRTRMLGSGFQTFQDFRKHYSCSHTLAKSVALSAPPCCPLCNKEFVSIEELKTHIFGFHDPPAVCHCCWSPIKSYQTDMAHHVWSHLNDQEKEISNQPKRPQRPSSSVSKKKKDSHLCNVCGKEYSSAGALSLHEETHLPKEMRTSFDCPYCSLKLLSKAVLQNHIERIHRPDLQKRMRECPICGKQFHYSDGHSLRRHMQNAHTDGTPFICEICGKGFKGEASVKRHTLEVHFIEKLFKCEFCEKSYKRYSHLKGHHNKEHPEHPFTKAS